MKKNKKRKFEWKQWLYQTHDEYQTEEWTNKKAHSFVIFMNFDFCRVCVVAVYVVVVVVVVGYPLP